MKQLPIPDSDWPQFCRQFTRQHRGWMFRLAEVESERFRAEPAAAERDARPLADLMPLKHVSLRDDDGGGQLTIAADAESGDVECVLPDPVQIDFDQSDDGLHRGLDVYMSSGQTVLMRFRAPAQPEMLDGLAESELPESPEE